MFENTKIPLKKWFMAIYLHTAHKKGISSNQLAKDISTTQKTAWFMLQRIREISSNFNNDKFDGTTEMDETYCGGKTENKNNPVKKEKAKEHGVKKKVRKGMRTCCRKESKERHENMGVEKIVRKGMKT